MYQSPLAVTVPLIVPPPTWSVAGYVAEELPLMTMLLSKTEWKIHWHFLLPVQLSVTSPVPANVLVLFRAFRVCSSPLSTTTPPVKSLVPWLSKSVAPFVTLNEPLPVIRAL